DLARAPGPCGLGLGRWTIRRSPCARIRRTTASRATSGNVGARSTRAAVWRGGQRARYATWSLTTSYRIPTVVRMLVGRQVEEAELAQLVRDIRRARGRV